MLYEVIINFNNNLYIVIDLDSTRTGDQHYFDKKEHKYQFKLKNACFNLIKHNNRSKHLSRDMFKVKIIEK